MWFEINYEIIVSTRQFYTLYLTARTIICKYRRLSRGSHLTAEGAGSDAALNRRWLLLRGTPRDGAPRRPHWGATQPPHTPLRGPLTHSGHARLPRASPDARPSPLRGEPAASVCGNLSPSGHASHPLPTSPTPNSPLSLSRSIFLTDRSRLADRWTHRPTFTLTLRREGAHAGSQRSRLRVSHAAGRAGRAHLCSCGVSKGDVDHVRSSPF